MVERAADGHLRIDMFFGRWGSASRLPTAERRPPQPAAARLQRAMVGGLQTPSPASGNPALGRRVRSTEDGVFGTSGPCRRWPRANAAAANLLRRRLDAERDYRIIGT